MNNHGEEHPHRHALIWLIPAVALLIALATINRWLPDPLSTYHSEQARLMDDENKAACLKFVSGSEPVTRCIAEIGLLRHRDREGGQFY
jgi:hypothetical protein